MSFADVLFSRQLRLVLAGIGILAAVGALVFWLLYLDRLADPAFRDLVESHGMSAYEGESIDRTKADEWREQISQTVSPHWQRIDVSAGIAVLSLGLLLTSSVLQRSIAGGRHWAVSAGVVAILVIIASILLPVAFIASAVQDVMRGLVPVYTDSLGPLMMVVPGFFLFSLLLLLALNFALLGLKQDHSLATSLRHWSVLGSMRNVSIGIVFLALSAVVGLLAMHPFFSVPGVLVAAAMMCVLCRGEPISVQSGKVVPQGFVGLQASLFEEPEE